MAVPQRKESQAQQAGDCGGTHCKVSWMFAGRWVSLEGNSVWLGWGQQRVIEQAAIEVASESDWTEPEQNHAACGDKAKLHSSSWEEFCFKNGELGIPDTLHPVMLRQQTEEEESLAFSITWHMLENCTHNVSISHTQQKTKIITITTTKKKTQCLWFLKDLIRVRNSPPS